MASSFEKSGFALVRGFIAQETCALIAEYIDQQLPLEMIERTRKGPVGGYAEYSTALSDSLLRVVTPRVERIVGRNLYPAFSFLRIYAPGEDLEVHRDREACEICVSLHVAQWPSPGVGSGGCWPLYCAGEALSCAPGDAVVFKGTEIKHWREVLQGSSWGILMLHYVYADGLNVGEKFDRRPALGVSKEYLAREIPISPTLCRHGIGPEHWAVWRSICFAAASDQSLRDRLVDKPIATLKEFGIAWTGSKTPQVLEDTETHLTIITPAAIELLDGCTTLYWRRWVGTRVWQASGRSVERFLPQQVVDCVATRCLLVASWNDFNEMLNKSLRQDLLLDFRFQSQTVVDEETDDYVRVLLPGRFALIWQ